MVDDVLFGKTDIFVTWDHDMIVKDASQFSSSLLFIFFSKANYEIYLDRTIIDSYRST
jgi:hypothetical protein